MLTYQRLSRLEPTRFAISRSELAYALLSDDCDPTAKNGTVATMIATGEPLAPKNALYVLSALDKSVRWTLEEIQTLADALEKAEMLLATKSASPSAPVGPNNPLTLFLMTTRDGSKLLPVFTSVESFQDFAPESTTLSHRLPTARALQLAVVLNLDGIEFDTASQHCCRIDRSMIDACLGYLDNSAF